MYYTRLLREIQPTDVDLEQMKNKIKDLRNKYRDAIQWKNRTGQGIFGEKVCFSQPYAYDNLNDEVNHCDELEAQQVVNETLNDEGQTQDVAVAKDSFERHDLDDIVLDMSQSETGDSQTAENGEDRRLPSLSSKEPEMRCDPSRVAI